jgi:hypothetical protein
VRNGLYWVMFVVESAGMIFILRLGIPLYRRLASGPGGYRPGESVVFPVFVAAAVMQFCYWSKREIRPPLGRGRSVVVGHLLFFLSRLSFIFAASTLPLALYMRLMDTQVTVFGVLVLLFATFAQFCYVRELEALARIVEEEPPKERSSDTRN